MRCVFSLGACASFLKKSFFSFSRACSIRARHLLGFQGVSRLKKQIAVSFLRGCALLVAKIRDVNFFLCARAARRVKFFSKVFRGAVSGRAVGGPLGS